MTTKQTVTVKNKFGFHTRPAMKLFQIINHLDAEITLTNNEGKKANANSLLALMMLNSATGSQIEIEAWGKEEKRAMEAITELFDENDEH